MSQTALLCRHPILGAAYSKRDLSLYMLPTHVQHQLPMMPHRKTRLHNKDDHT